MGASRGALHVCGGCDGKADRPRASNPNGTTPAAGATSLRDIATGLNARGFPISHGGLEAIKTQAEMCQTCYIAAIFVKGSLKFQRCG